MDSGGVSITGYTLPKDCMSGLELCARVTGQEPAFVFSLDNPVEGELTGSLRVHELGKHQLLAINLEGHKLNVGSCGGHAFATIGSETSLSADPPRT